VNLYGGRDTFINKGTVDGIIDFGTGEDIFKVGSTNKTVNDSFGKDNFPMGAGGLDELWDLAGSDALSGGDGNDYLVGGAAKDMLEGGESTDFVPSMPSQKLARALWSKAKSRATAKQTSQSP
jgi:Ca2+-binding RTX toxin-like protein